MFEGQRRQHTRLGPTSLLFTNMVHIGAGSTAGSTVGRSDATPITLSTLDAMRLQYQEGGGGLVAEVETSIGGTSWSVLVMKNFLGRVVGDDATSSLQLELSSVATGSEDKSLFFADFEEHTAPTHTVCALHKHPALQQTRNIASMWTMQDHPLIGQVGPLVHDHVQGRCVHWYVCLRECTLESKQGVVELGEGDVYVMLPSSV
jgi:hypothetical protein